MTPDWTPLRETIEGVHFREVKNILTRTGGVTTEVYREDWGLEPAEVKHIIHVILPPQAVSAWHCHRVQTDRIFVVLGRVKIALFDDRDSSPTRGVVSAFHLGLLRPGLLVIPPGVWHGLKNDASEPAGFINFFDHAYRYEDPDEWRLPADTPKIPFKF